MFKMFKIFKIFNLFNLLNLLNLFTTASLHIKPTGRMFHNAVLNKNHNKNEIWMLGGIQQPPGINRTCLEDCSGPISNGLWKYNIDENTWCYNNVSFPKRRGSSIVSNNDFIYILGGGITNTKNPFLSIPLSDMWRYDKSKTDTEGDGHGDSDGDTEMQWTQIKTNNPDIYLHESVITDDGQIYSLGGFDTNGHSPYLYIFDGKKWSREIAFPFSKNISETSTETSNGTSSGTSSGIWGHSMTLVDKRYIYVIGGTCGPPTETTSFNKDVWTYDILTKKWNLECGGIPIYGHRACHVERHLVTNNHLQGLQDPDNSVEYLYSDNHISFPNDDIIITGGFYPTKNVKNNEGATHLDGTTKNIYCFNTRSRTWKYMGSMQKPREFHSAIFINDVIFVFGGYHIGYFWDNGEVIYLMKK